MLEFDVRVLRTLRRLLFSPGVLTREYAAGRQTHYTPPIRLYVVTSAVVIALMNVLGAFELDQILSTWSEDARAALAAATGVSDFDDPDVQESFNRRMDLVFPIVNLFSPIGMMLLLKAVYRRRFAQEHLAFSCHCTTFLVILTTPALLVEGIAQQVVFVVATVTSLAYLLVAMRRVYGGGWFGLVARFALVSLGFLALVAVLANLSFFIVIRSI
ncbi:MAG: DUF3667 domain-containing protein [Gammaproteobacteria bacterium]|nr:DUF3667 domain-containing protein [Gammaproteobacteria bacterium]